MKKTILTFVILFLTIASLMAQAGQITNNGFNSWSSNGYNPIGWTTVASALPAALDTTQYAAYTTLLQSSFAPTATQDQSDKEEGISSIKLTTITTPSIAQSILGTTTPGVVGLGNLDIAAVDAGSPVILTGSAFSFQPDTILFRYKYEPAGTDTATFSLYFKNGGNDVAGGVITKYLFSTGGAWATDTTIITTWTNPPDSAVFQISSGWQQGSVLHIDALHFGYVTPLITIPTVSMIKSTDTINAGEIAYLIATLSQSTIIPLTVNIYGGGTADYQTDYVPSNHLFLFDAGETADTITITTNPYAANKYLIAALAPSTNNTYHIASVDFDTLFIKAAISSMKETEIEKEAIELYPIPASSSVTVVVPSEVPTQNINIIDLNGKVVAVENNISGKTFINLGNLTNGKYLMTFTDAVTNTHTTTKQLQVVK